MSRRFGQQAVSGVSLGLLSMEERASLAGGGLEFISAKDKAPKFTPGSP